MTTKERETGNNKKEVNIYKAIEQQQKRRERLLNELVYYWDYANNTSYYKQFRAHKLYQMIYWITSFIDDPTLFSKDERYMLLNLIRQISLFQIEKSATNKKEIIKSLKELETLRA